MVTQLEIKMVPVASSNIQSIGYDKKTETLRMKFHSGYTYDYEGVPATVHKLLMADDEKTAFAREQIFGRYKQTRL
jgi:hypothetical protein